MPKRAVPISRPEISLDARLPMPLYKQLYERLRRGILSGHLASGTRLPSTRQLANELGIARTTVVLAYEQLLLEGYLQSRVGQGTVVAHDLPVPPLLEPPEPPEDMPQPSVLRLASRVHSLQEALAPLHYASSPRGIYQGGEPDVEQFPYEVWARLIARRARQALRQVAHYLLGPILLSVVDGNLGERYADLRAHVRKSTRMLDNNASPRTSVEPSVHVFASSDEGKA